MELQQCNVDLGDSSFFLINYLLNFAWGGLSASFLLGLQNQAGKFFFFLLVSMNIYIRGPCTCTIREEWKWLCFAAKLEFKSLCPLSITWCYIMVVHFTVFFLFVIRVVVKPSRASSVCEWLYSFIALFVAIVHIRKLLAWMLCPDLLMCNVIQAY